MSKGASEYCAAAFFGILLSLLASACQPAPPFLEPARARVYTAPPPSPDERTCAWFGDASEKDGVLYFGESAFWAAYQASGGDPEADLRVPGPQLLGRFQLGRHRFLPALDVGRPSSRTGVWDVLVHPGGRVFFTTFFDLAGWVDPRQGTLRHLPEAGLGLNELALGWDGRVLVTRYGYARDSRGSVVVLDPDGIVEAEYPLRSPPGTRVAAKSVAFDPLRREIWVNTDLLPLARGDRAAVASGRPAGVGPTHPEAIRHDVRILSRAGREILRLERPEVQFMTFSSDGTGYFAELEGPRLRLRIRPPERAESPVLTGRIVALDDDFPVGLDFVQEIRPGAAGRVVVTRWSGRIHVVGPEGGVRDLQLPREGGRGLYYTGILHGQEVCATRCDAVSVVCAPLSH